MIEEAGVSLTIPAGSRDAPYAVLLETGGENCEGGLEPSMGSRSPATR